jgi:hypothetical protein
LDPGQFVDEGGDSHLINVSCKMMVYVLKTDFHGSPAFAPDIYLTCRIMTNKYNSQAGLRSVQARQCLNTG